MDQILINKMGELGGVENSSSLIITGGGGGLAENSTNESLLEILTVNSTRRNPLLLLNESEYIFDRVWVRAIFITVYTIVFVSCFFGNLVVILVINLHWRMRSITNFCLSNLAFANLCVGVFCVYQNLSTYLITSWVFGDFMCKMYHFINSLSHTASILILVVICIERYLAIIHPIRSRQILTLNRLRVCISAVWIISAIYCSPRLYYITTITIPRRDKTIEILCIPKRTLYDSHTFDVINFLILFLLPLAVISIQYTIIGITLWRSSRNHIMSPSGADNSSFNTSNSSLDHHAVQGSNNGAAVGTGMRGVAAMRNAQSTDTDCPSTPSSPTERVETPQGHASCLPNCVRRYHNRRSHKQLDTVPKVPNDEELNNATSGDEHERRASPIASISMTVESQLAMLFSDNATNNVIESPAHPPNRSSRRVSFRTRRVPSHVQTINIKRSSRKLFRFREKMKAFRMDECCDGRTRTLDPQDQQVSPSAPETPVPTNSRSHQQHKQHSGPTASQKLKLRRTGGIKNNRFGAQALQSRRRVVRMLIAIVVTFALCNLPFHGRKLWQIWSSSYKGGSMFSTLFTPITFIIMYANCAINPILYAFMSTTFRLSLKELLCCRMKRRHNNNALHRQESMVASNHT